MKEERKETNDAEKWRLNSIFFSLSNRHQPHLLSTHVEEIKANMGTDGVVATFFRVEKYFGFPVRVCFPGSVRLCLGLPAEKRDASKYMVGFH